MSNQDARGFTPQRWEIESHGYRVERVLVGVDANGRERRLSGMEILGRYEGERLSDMIRELPTEVSR